MSSVRNLPPHAEAYGVEALHRSRRLSLLSLTAGLCAGLLVLSLAQPVRSVRVSPPLVMDMRTLPPPSATPRVAEVSAEMVPLLAESAPYSVALPPKAVKPEPSKVVPPEPPKTVTPEPAQEVSRKALIAKEKTRQRAKTKPATPKPATPAPREVSPVSPPLAEAEAAGTAEAPAGTVGIAGTGRVGVSATPANAGQPTSRDQAAALAVLMQAIERHKSYPRNARRTGAQGTAELLVQVGPDGKVVASELRQGSGHAVLDSATRQLGQKLQGLDTGVRGKALRIVVPVSYRLS